MRVDMPDFTLLILHMLFT